MAGSVPRMPPGGGLDMATDDAQVRVFGIRHHGPGSARSLRRALEALDPDAILIEGPPEANALIPLAAHAGMRPPVALLVYMPDEPQRAIFYPFALFSPEWQAIQHGVSRGIAVRFMDLPQRNWMAMREPEPEADCAREPQESPLDALARAAGMDAAHGECWWTRVVEERTEEGAIFPAILEAMTALREGATPSHPLEPLREAAMRRAIRRAQRDGFRRIAAVCGAWHAPALVDMPAAGADGDLLKGLPRVKVAATWVPWTYGHLAYASGYGAGISSPGWYEHLWTTPEETTVRWLGRVAQLLRERDLDASSAQVIDAVRLAESLSALRGRARPGLSELNEATRSVFCMGDALPLELIRAELIVGDRLGQVPGEATAVPLQRDLAAVQRRLRLRPEAEPRQLDLDLRKPNDLARSHLLHRLNLLGVPWGVLEPARRQRGTFHEFWTVQWQPALAVSVIQAAVWGNTVIAAATTRARDLAGTAPDLATVTALLEQILLADLDEAVGDVVRYLQAKTALTGDVIGLMEAVPPLVRTLRYGDVRHDAGTFALDRAAIERVIDGLAARIFVGLPLACASLDDDAARRMLEHVDRMHVSLASTQRADLVAGWLRTLAQLADQEGLHGVLAGRCCRVLYDQGTFGDEEVARRLRLALSRANEPARSAAWLEGLLKGSGLLLLQDHVLWAILDEWVAALPGKAFDAVLPLLRRAFAAFSAPERRQMGELARRGPGAQLTQEANVDRERADAVLPVLARILG